MAAYLIKFKKIVAIILLVIILAFIFVFSVELFNKIFIELSEIYRSSAIAAFFGAFMAFLFVRMSDFLKAHADRVSRHAKSLKSAQILLTDVRGRLIDNIGLVDKFSGVCRGAIFKPDGDNFIWGLRLHSVPLLDPELTSDILSSDLLNRLLFLNLTLRKLNESINVMNNFYFELREAFLSKGLEPAIYIARLKELLKSLERTKRQCELYSEDVLYANAAVALLVPSSGPALGLVNRMFFSIFNPTDFETKISGQVKKMLAEERAYSAVYQTNQQNKSQ